MRLTTHPIHPPLVHFPIALLGTSLLFDVVGLVREDPVWWAIAFWNIALGLAVAVVTASTGLFDSLKVPEQSPASPVVIRHLSAMAGALTLYGAALAVRAGPAAPQGWQVTATLTLELAGLVLLVLGGFWGGELVYRHGIGRLPDDDETQGG